MQGIEDKPSAGIWIRGVDARVKMIAVVIFIINATTLQDKTLLLTTAFLLLGISLIAGISPVHLVKRLAVILPFGGVMVSVIPFVTPGEPVWTLQLGAFKLAVTKEGWEAAVLPCLRMLTAFLGMAFLTSTTSLREMTHALNHLKFPKILILLIDFTVRYIAVVMDELNRMQTARKARGFKPGRGLWDRHTVKTIGSTLAMLFLRSYERAERVYLAMLSRGYTGRYKCCGHCHRIKKLDLSFGAAMITVSWAIKLVDMGGIQWNLLLK
ncbi:cobalt ECF transporter T component CbiQ [Desulforamulus putei]|uniref:cobalt ECF transporter T component CbiQ n=1 Tax=Desulforamulus putei TaxID=74701 RepID=UPI002FDE80DC